MRHNSFIGVLALVWGCLSIASCGTIVGNGGKKKSAREEIQHGSNNPSKEAQDATDTFIEAELQNLRLSLLLNNCFSPLANDPVGSQYELTDTKAQTISVNTMDTIHTITTGSAKAEYRIVETGKIDIIALQGFQRSVYTCGSINVAAGQTVSKLGGIYDVYTINLAISEIDYQLVAYYQSLGSEPNLTQLHRIEVRVNNNDIDVLFLKEANE